MVKDTAGRVCLYQIQYFYIVTTCPAGVGYRLWATLLIHYLLNDDELDCALLPSDECLPPGCLVCHGLANRMYSFIPG